MNEIINGRDVKPGMILKTAMDDYFAVERVDHKWGAVQIRSNGRLRGLGTQERVTVIGYFNVED